MRRTCTFLLPLALVALLIPSAHCADDAATDKVKVARVLISSNTAEEPPAPNPLGPTRLNFRGKLEQIRAIAADPEIAGVRLVIKGAPDLAHALDLLDALRSLKAAGKPVVCYAEELTRNDALFATLADYLVVPPSGIIGLDALVAEVMYFKELLAKLHLRVEVLHIGEYKTAFENFALPGMSDGQRVMLESLLDEFYGQIVSTIAGNRGMSLQEVEELFGLILVEPTVAAEAGLIDAAVYEDEFDAEVARRLGGEVDLIEEYGGQSKEDIEKMLENPFMAMNLVMKALNPPKPKLPKAPYVVVVYASGVITSGKSQSDFTGNVTSMGSETIVEALEKAGEDDNCKAVVLRVNSPGGSALASDMIWRAIARVQESKPVVASMGDLAASGGYWISMGCNAIVAQPSTLTGSIGVVSMLPDVSQATGALGINVEVVARGPHGDQLALLKHGPTPVVRETLTRWMESAYDTFIHKVAAGRGMAPERIRELAAGRVWTGRQAEQNGLVDSLGGLTEAIEVACAMAGLSPSDTPVVEYPEAPNFLEMLEESMEELVLGRGPLATAYRVLGQLGQGELVFALEQVLADGPTLHAGRLQALMPFSVRIR